MTLHNQPFTIFEAVIIANDDTDPVMIAWKGHRAFGYAPDVARAHLAQFCGLTAHPYFIRGFYCGRAHLSEDSIVTDLDPAFDKEKGEPWTIAFVGERGLAPAHDVPELARTPLNEALDQHQRAKAFPGQPLHETPELPNDRTSEPRP